MKYIVKYEGSFGFIKPWSAVRDSKTKSSFYLTPSILTGIERKLFPENDITENVLILKHRLSFSDVTFQQEMTSSVNYELKKVKGFNNKYYERNASIVNRGLLLYPVLYLMFDSYETAYDVMAQHICLCRNEDIMLPTKLITINDESEFDNEEIFSGYESFPCNEEENNSIYCGLNKYTKKKQFITCKIVGIPDNLK